MPSTFAVTTDRREDVVTVAVAGEVDIATAPQLVQALLDAARLDAGTIDVDASRLEFLDSSGVRGLLVAQEAADRRGQRLRLVRPHRAVTEVLSLLELERSFGLGAPRADAA